MKNLMLLIFFLFFTTSLQADASTLLLDCQGVLSKMNTSLSTIMGFVNASSTSTNVLEFQYIDKRYFSALAFFIMLVTGVIYLQHKENRFAEL